MLEKLKARRNQKALRAFDTNREKKYSTDRIFRHAFINDGLKMVADRYEGYFKHGKMSKLEFQVKYCELVGEDMTLANHDGNMGTL